jgi:8-oxo-dGTP pyrophosphatase MutT (NUDIX family)
MRPGYQFRKGIGMSFLRNANHVLGRHELLCRSCDALHSTVHGACCLCGGELQGTAIGGAPSLVMCRTIDCEYVACPMGEVRHRPAAYALANRGPLVLMYSFFRETLGTVAGLPGGGVEVHETHAATVMRETLEEVGYGVRVGGLLHVAEEFFLHPRSGPVNSSAHFYHCRVDEAASPQRPTKPDERDARAFWFDTASRDGARQVRPHPFVVGALGAFRERYQYSMDAMGIPYGLG